MGLRFSQTKLGGTIDVTFQQIQKYENGTNRIGASNLYKIAKTLGVEVGFFYDGIEDAVATVALTGLADQRATEFEHDPMSSREAIELMHNFFRIPDPVVRKRLFKFVKSLAGSATAG